MRPVFVLAILAGALYSAPAAAFRVEFEVVQNGVRIEGAEVCFQPAANADGTYVRWLSSGDVRCFPADDVLDFPVGRWNYFARHADGLISANPQLINLESAEPEQGYHAAQIVVEPAATLDVSGIRLTPNQQLFLFFANRHSSLGSAIHPVTRGTTSQLVPAETDIVPLVVEGGRPVRLLERVHAEGGKTVAARERHRIPNTVDLVCWIQLDVVALLKTDKPESLAQFNAQLRIGERVIREDFPIKHAAASHLSLVMFSGVPKGEARIEIQGGDWLPYRRQIVLDRDVVVLDEPLTTAPAGHIRVTWDLPRGSFARDRPCGSEKPVPEAVVTAQRCTADGHCKTFDMRIGEMQDTGEVHFPRLAPGGYAITAALGDFQSEPVHIENLSGKTTVVDVTPRVEVIRGRVLKGQSPFSAFLQFERGTAQSAPLTGEYTLLLDRPIPGDSIVQIEPCDGSPSLTEVVASDLVDGGVVDLEVAAHAVVVETRDDGSGRPVTGAEITHRISSSGGGALAVRQAGKTDGDGKMSLVLPKRRSTICASARNYAESCVELSRTSASGVTRIPLKRAHERHGRILSSTPLRGAVMFLAGAAGEVIETISVRDDATFSCACHTPPSYVVLVSDTHPLLVLPPPAEVVRHGEQELHVQIAPTQAIRAFQVSVAPTSATRGGRLSLNVDGKHVPLLALTNHQIKHGQPTVVMRGEEVSMPDLAGSSIEVVLLPFYEDLPPHLMGTDVAVLREWQPVLPRKGLDLSGRVIFE